MVSFKALSLLGLLGLSISFFNAFSLQYIWQWQWEQASVQPCFCCSKSYKKEELINPCRHKHEDALCLSCYQAICWAHDACPLCATSYDRSIACLCQDCIQEQSNQLQTCYICCQEYDNHDLLNPCRHDHSDLMCLPCYQHVVQQEDRCPLCRASFERCVPCDCDVCNQPDESPAHQAVVGECCICFEECELLSPCPNNHPAFICSICIQQVEQCPLCRHHL